MGPLLLAAALAVAPAESAPVVDDDARGRALRRTGHPREAAAYLERAAKAHPADADVWLDLGLARAATGELEGAKEALDRAAALAPNYLDVQIAQARVAYFRGDLVEARERVARVRQSAPDNPEARELEGQIARAVSPGAWRLDASYSQAWLSRDLPSATDAIIALTRLSRGGGALTGSIEQVHQFGVSDTFVELQAARRFGYVAIGGTPDADFRPRWSVRGGLVSRPRPIGGGWSVQLALDAGWARYPVGNVRALHPSLTLARGEQLDLQLRWVNVLDERNRYQTGYALRGNWRAASKMRLTLGWSEAPESDVGVTVNVRAATAGVALDVGQATTLRLGLTHEMRPAYDRDELAVGFGRRF